MTDWAKKTVLLHVDKKMKQIKEAPHNQPSQLDLFQMLINDNYSNSVELYQTLPDVFSWKQDKLRNPDGSLPVLSRTGMYNKTSYTLDISPANISVISKQTGKPKIQGFYKTVIAEFIELALHKLSIADGFFVNSDTVKTEDFGLITTFYQLREELKSMGKNYSYDQIRDGITILSWLRYKLSGDISREYGIDSFFSPIDLIIRTDKKNPNHSELFITFNKFISKKILALDWRSFNYAEFMKLKSSFWRAIFLRLNYRFQQADPVKWYHFLLSTLIKEWILQDALITTNFKKIKEGLADCGYIIDRYNYEPIYELNPSTKRKKLNDYKITVYPTAQFQEEQYRVNIHHQNIEQHRITDDWKTVIKPMADQYPSSDRFNDYVIAEKEYMAAYKWS